MFIFVEALFVVASLSVVAAVHSVATERAVYDLSISVHRPTPAGIAAGWRLRVLEMARRSRIVGRLAAEPVPHLLLRARWEMSAVRMGMLRLVLGAAVGCATVALPMPGPVLLPFTSLIGSKMPLIALRRAAKRRLSAIDADIPQLLDLMAVASSAGMSAPMGLRRSAATINGPLAEEIAAVAAQVDLGTRWRDALSQMSDLLQLPDLSRMVAVIARTETLGVSLSESTRELASVVRHTRRASTMARARTAPVKMLFPLVFLVLPAFLLLTVVPVLLTTLRSVH